METKYVCFFKMFVGVKSLQNHCISQTIKISIYFSPLCVCACVLGCVSIVVCSVLFASCLSVCSLLFEGSWLASHSLLEQLNESKHFSVIEVCEKKKNL